MSQTRAAIDVEIIWTVILRVVSEFHHTEYSRLSVIQV